MTEDALDARVEEAKQIFKEAWDAEFVEDFLRWHNHLLPDVVARSVTSEIGDFERREIKNDLYRKDRDRGYYAFLIVLLRVLTLSRSTRGVAKDHQDTRLPDLQLSSRI